MDKENPIVDQDLLEKINQKLERKTKEVEIIQQVSSQINATLNRILVVKSNEKALPKAPSTQLFFLQLFAQG